MSLPNRAQQELTPIYQCDSHLHHTLRSARDHLHQLCAHHANRLVRAETMDGDVFEGHILHSDRGIVYLSLSNESYARAFFPPPLNPTANFVLPLVLFNLLTISLL
ncbi:hypothetical protein ACFPVX_18670 [Cohnella faecalis]|uniref:Uncharacterized protein n=1 Tax=Cohnella faecalis TaxID=2315694 RepID=A0A398CMQ0_9BACL|nr:hypothetical protein [Cohnella faecalis]RIE01177.1 hypothetical protein D3H35_22515 [Cohnella faecalis]